jgi:predicted ester cyclase
MKARGRFAGVVGCALLLATTSCQGQAASKELAGFKAMEAKKARNIETVKSFYEHLDGFLNERDQKAFMSLWAPDSKRFGGSADKSMSIEEMTPFLKEYYSAFPDFKHQFLNVVADGDYVVVQLKYTGTQRADFMGVHSSGRKIECKGIHVLKVTGDKIAELHFVDDDLTMFSQLGRELK